MFFFLGLLWVVLGAIPLGIALTRQGKVEPERFRRGIKRGTIIFTAAILLLIAVNVAAALYIDYLWFANVGYTERFLTVLGLQLGLFFGGTVLAFLLFWPPARLMVDALFQGRNLWVGPALAAGAAILLGAWASGIWSSFVMYLNEAPTDVTDPIFERQISFYLFSLPFLERATGWLFFVAIAGLIGVGLSLVSRNRETRPGEEPTGEERSRGINWLLGYGALVLVLLAWNAYLNIFRLMYSTEGVVTGPGYVDVNYRVVAYHISIALYLVAALIVAAGAFSPGLRRKLIGLRRHPSTGAPVLSGRAAIVPTVVVVALITVNGILPWAVQSFVVSPNEITLERPYIEHNIQYTRWGYGIDDERIDQQQVPVARQFDEQARTANQATLSNVRLWDWRALMDNLKQQQEIRLYYEFSDVDVDRYRYGGDYRQIMLAVRELEKSALAPQSQTWVSRKLKYTHGFGLTMTPVHEVLPQGKPRLIVRNIPPVVTVDGLTVSEPRIYYGERTMDHVYVNTTQQEFDYPSGEQNVNTNYQGEGGVPISSLFRKFIYAWKFDGVQMLFSGYIDRDAKIMYRREIRRRVAELAPFLMQDQDPYAVLQQNGKIAYIVDLYTVSDNYPYSEAYTGRVEQMQGTRYVRNSVKAVVDAANGTVDFYVVDPEDPIARTYRNAFPELFKDLEQMPDYLRAHIRYPVDILLVQSEMYSVYHMEDPEVFYQREDVWQFATERYRDTFTTVTPYYVMLQLPDSEGAEFVLMVPFTPKNKNVMNAWIGARSDEPHYGELVVYTLPKGVEVLGPRQIEARIDQNTQMSQSLTLWGQRGSEVIRGNLLAIPLFKDSEMVVLYVEPIFLQAENAQLPELKRVVLADQDRVVWGEDFETAVERLIQREQVPAIPEAPAAEAAQAAGAEAAPGAATLAAAQRIDRANRLLQQYLDQTAQGNFQEAGRRLQQLQDVLQSADQGGE